MAGESFTAADISVAYALQFARRAGGVALTEIEESYLARATAREGYRRAMAACHATREWVERIGGG